MDGLESIAARVTAAIGDAIRAGEAGDATAGMPASFVLVANYHDQDGEARTLFITADGQLLHETLGLLDMGQTVWRGEAVDWARGGAGE